MRFEARERFAATPERLWPLVSDTQRLNRVLGLPVIRFTPQPLPTGGSRTIGEHPFGSAVLSLAGQVIPLPALRRPNPRVLRWLPQLAVARWIEHPFEWEEPRRYAVLREYYWSLLGLFPFASFHGGVELIPIEGGTEVVAFANVTPRNALGSLLTRLILGPRNVQGVIEQCRLFEQYLLGRAPHPFPQLTREDRAGPTPLVAGAAPNQRAVAPPATETTSAVAELRPETSNTGSTEPLFSGWQALARTSVPTDLVEQFRRHLLEAPDEEVHKMRPFELADRWGAERRQTLALFLHATTAGLLEMTWDVLCPNCRISNAGYSSLSEFQSEAHCDACNVTYDALVDRQVEVRFTAAPAIRAVQTHRFCTGGPMNLSHVVAQAELSPGERRELQLALREGEYRLRSPQVKSAAVLTLDHQSEPADPLSFVLRLDGVQPPLVDTAAGTIRLQLLNESEVPALLSLERSEWPDTAATASYVGTLQEFRDLFGSEVLAPGLQLAVQRLAFLFTDLTGSTALYQAVGQARAFRLVQDHFRVLGRVITSHNGALVKTIGDAVMATFNTGDEALQAALAMQQEMRRLDTDGAVDPAQLLKVGIHEGPCIAVGANGRLDYFGTTVNMAARVQHESRGGEIVLSADVYGKQGVQEILQEGFSVAESTATLRGIREPMKIYRIATALPLPLA